MWRNPFKREDHSQCGPQIVYLPAPAEPSYEETHYKVYNREDLRKAFYRLQKYVVDDVQEWGWSEDADRIRYSLSRTTDLTGTESWQARQVLDRIEHAAHCDMTFQPDPWALITDTAQYEQWKTDKERVRDLVPTLALRDEEEFRLGPVMGREQLFEAFERLPQESADGYLGSGWSLSVSRIRYTLDHGDALDTEETDRARALVSGIESQALYGWECPDANPASVISDRQSFQSWVESSYTSHREPEPARQVPPPLFQQGGQ
ncbi:hypothetical protein ACIRRA_13485 [Nocardia sp. NPDC101769]|uniref:hypothetical protein n=1 Tax=Nocardia sp. NPDC101769 TaxID=3364333 RepID=UPI0038300642